MNKTLAKLMTCYIFDSQKRKKKRKELLARNYPIAFLKANDLVIKASRPDNIKLIMTLVVKDEEAIIEQNIRFHHAMGVDGFIVTNHNSTDKTSEILDKLTKEGLVLKIINKDTV